MTSRLLRDPAYRALKDFVVESTGLAYYVDKDEDLADRIERRMSKRNVQDCAAYLCLLKDGHGEEAELDALITELTIGETHFFRHREQFDALRDVVLPDLIERNRHTRRVRIWSAGCATGAEPYSVAILLKRELAHLVAGWEVSILGTDINREFLTRAREGRFEEWAFRSTPEDLKLACFSRSGKSYIIAPEYREWVSFQYHNLVRHPFPSLLSNLSAFDLILCRNVTIYFAPDVIRRMIAQFHECLVDGGWLLVGHAEPNTELFWAFRTVNVPGAVLYQKDVGQAINAGGFASGPTLETVATWTPPSLPEPDLLLEKKVPCPQTIPRRGDGESAEPTPSGLAAVRLLADQGRWEEAARRCEELLKTDRLNPAVHFYHALVLEQMGFHDETERSLQRAIYLDRTFVLAHYHLGLFLQRKGKAQGAARSFQNVLRLLSRMEDDRVFSDGDGITAVELRELSQIHLEVLKGA